jgi:hypothetical protein
MRAKMVWRAQPRARMTSDSMSTSLISPQLRLRNDRWPHLQRGDPIVGPELSGCGQSKLGDPGSVPERLP